MTTATIQKAPGQTIHHPLRPMVLVSSGEAVIGSNEGSETERPERTINLSSFWLDSTPVTNAQFEVFVRETGYRTTAERRGFAWGWDGSGYRDIPRLNWRAFAAASRQDHPVVMVSWYDAAAYAEWAGARLPSEFEWEKAARAGRSTLFPWGEALPDGTQSNWARPPSSTPATSAVREHAPNPWGLFDMVGNVWQWCADVVAAPLDLASSDRVDITLRARRGGAWNVVQSFRLRCSNRGALPADGVAPNLGFRCARDANP